MARLDFQDKRDLLTKWRTCDSDLKKKKKKSFPFEYFIDKFPF
ncbi:hypothetical protein PUN28_019328 [Cardiocondyla obscurior]|uniref:Uncharacterized protein n=1 Tax=Cardiocondyla obscurior TaxID=286306 RepID=A0AAW2EEQ6_9HYME